MAVNQAQVDHIISTASADDPEVKLLKLQDEVELLKTSIKRLLIDIRERMNDMENPFNAGMQGGMGGGSVPGMGPSQAEVASALQDAAGAVHSAAGALKVTQQIHDGVMAEAEVNAHVPQQGAAVPAPITIPSVQPSPNTSVADQAILDALRAQLASTTGTTAPVMKEPDHGKVRLQKVFRLFEWTNRTVKKYGHDRVDLMLESYRAMGYISDDSAKLVRDITRLMPTTLGELHEISADEFVSELYELNRILEPSDSSLDRDMIEVLMEKRGIPERNLQSSRENRGEEEQRDSGFIQSNERI